MPNRQSIPLTRRVAVFLFLLMLFSSVSLPIGASIPTAPNIPDHSHVQAVILYSYDYKEALIEQNADKALFPASTVKIMTGFLAAELLSERMEETVAISADMIENASGNRMNLKEGEEIRIRDLYFGAICGGYNDACTALAVIASGSVDRFVEEMNGKAVSLGMMNTVYKNPTGLHSAAMITTARDTLKLSLAASTNDLYMEASSAVNYSIAATNKSASRTFYNRNYLIASAVTTEYHNPYVEGLNAGMTDEGGWCLSTKAFRNDLTWFCVILGGEEDPESGTLYAYSTANTLLSWAARGYTVKTAADVGESFGTIPVRYASIADETEDGIPLIAKNSIEVFIPTTPPEGEVGLEYKTYLHSTALTAPISEGTEAGVLIVTWNGIEVGRTALVTAHGVDRNDFTYALSRVKELPKNRVFQGTAVSFAFLLTLYIIIVSRFGFRRKRRSNKYVPIPFRDREDGQDSTPRKAVSQNEVVRPKAPPRDPYASAANELERRKKK